MPKIKREKIERADDYPEEKPSVREKKRAKRYEDEDPKGPYLNYGKDNTDYIEKILPLLSYDLLQLPTYISGEITRDRNEDTPIEYENSKRRKDGFVEDFFRKNPVRDTDRIRSRMSANHASGSSFQIFRPTLVRSGYRGGIRPGTRQIYSRE